MTSWIHRQADETESGPSMWLELPAPSLPEPSTLKPGALVTNASRTPVSANMEIRHELEAMMWVTRMEPTTGKLPRAIASPSQLKRKTPRLKQAKETQDEIEQ
ncbi:hypothetical protein A6R68_11169 [Neotoma lepida]|uniref:Uncharacterized protein n=1 Tax=Neotoma lepida TaxID=56216 RepID=A0A1A6FUS8_NEOLE|nr:hypothetical protein A6R68_11169 [Neotoma lepida]